jgi:hypothetical protein
LLRRLRSRRDRASASGRGRSARREPTRSDSCPIVLALKEWGDQQCAPGTEPVVFRHSCGAEFHPLTVCAACGQPVGPGELIVVGGTHPVRGEPW